MSSGYAGRFRLRSGSVSGRLGSGSCSAPANSSELDPESSISSFVSTSQVGFLMKPVVDPGHGTSFVTTHGGRSRLLVVFGSSVPDTDGIVCL